MRAMVLLLTMLFAAASGPRAAFATESVDSAYKLCTIVDGTGLASELCSVSGWNSAVTITLDMSSAEARKTCTALAQMMREEGWRFEKGWKLEFKSPYSNGKTIAYCAL